MQSTKLIVILIALFLLVSCAPTHRQTMLYNDNGYNSNNQLKNPNDEPRNWPPKKEG